MMPSVVGELGEEGPLGSAVAFTKRMHRVDVGEEHCELPDEVLTVQAPQSVDRSQPTEDIGGVGTKMLRQAEH